MAVADHTVSGEVFDIMECADCTARFTQHVPDEQSIGPYYKSENYISHTNTSKGLVNRLYQWVRKRTLRRKRRLVEKMTGIKKGQLLDVGSGTGAFVKEMKAHEWQVTGLEPDGDARTTAMSVNNVSLLPVGEFYSLPAGGFNAITLWHVLEHVHELNRYMERFRELLSENGRLFIAVPNYTSADAAIFREYWAAYDVPRHLYHFSPVSVAKLAEKHGMRVYKYLPMWYDSFYISMLSNKYRSGSIKLFSSFFTGLRSNMKATGDIKKCSSVIYVIGK